MWNLSMWTWASCTHFWVSISGENEVRYVVLGYRKGSIKHSYWLFHHEWPLNSGKIQVIWQTLTCWLWPMRPQAGHCLFRGFQTSRGSSRASEKTKWKSVGNCKWQHTQKRGEMGPCPADLPPCPKCHHYSHSFVSRYCLCKIRNGRPGDVGREVFFGHLLLGV